MRRVTDGRASSSTRADWGLRMFDPIKASAKLRGTFHPLSAASRIEVNLVTKLQLFRNEVKIGIVALEEAEA